MFVYLYLVLGRVPATVTSTPSGIQTNIQHPLRPFLTLTTCACGMTTHDCTLTRIAMFVYFSPPYMPHERRPLRMTTFGGREGRIGNIAWEDRGFERIPSNVGTSGMETVLPGPENASAASCGLGLSESVKWRAEQAQEVLRQGMVWSTR
jgi:hypothetical protein